MAKVQNKLSAVQVARIACAGLYGDGNGLYLQITKGGVKSWLFRYMIKGRARGMGLGPLRLVPLAEARKKAHDCRTQLLNGADPLELKDQHDNAERAKKAKAITFMGCAHSYIDAHKSGWKSAKHAAQWESTLLTYVEPFTKDSAVEQIDTATVMRILDPIWLSKTETASRVRGRLETILDWATVRGYRSGENPARWKGHLDHLLPKPSKVQRTVHHPALPHSEAPEFYKSLSLQQGLAPKAFQLLILTATRTSETIGCKWSEFDLRAQIWNVPASRMKAGLAHRIPLSDQAMALLSELKPFEESGFVFPGLKKGLPLSNMALLQVLKRMGRTDITAHGFRSTFRDWAGETTAYPREVAEAALAHLLQDKAEAAYARSDLLKRRGQMMQDWADFLYG